MLKIFCYKYIHILINVFYWFIVISNSKYIACYCVIRKVRFDVNGFFDFLKKKKKKIIEKANWSCIK